MPEQMLTDLKDDVVENNTIDEQVYAEYDVKRGLRNRDGSGVIAGLSKISSVAGTRKEGDTLVPIEGDLRYRGIPIKDLADQAAECSTNFEKAVFLLLVGKLPREDQLERFSKLIAAHRQVPKLIVDHCIEAIPSHNVMNKLQTVVSALYTEDSNPETVDPFDNFVKSISLIAKIPMIVAYAYDAAFQKSAKFITPPSTMTTAESFLYVLRQGKEASPVEIEILDLCLMLHAEHGGGNNSSFTTKVVSSSATDIYAAITAAIGSLKGPLHGAANKKVMEMMADIKGHVTDWDDLEKLRAYLAKIVQKKAHDRSGKIYGLGHAVYTLSDPRAVILKEKAKALAETKDRVDEYNLYLAVAEEAPKVFQEIKGSTKIIAPNVDFFSGFVYDCLDIPKEVYTPIFAMARSAGWCAHRIEEILSGKRVIRPAYKFVG